jgi:hypothetical protein
MKILANFDRAIAETLQEKVKARLTFKVRRGYPARDGKGRSSLIVLLLGIARHVPLLRRSVDLPYQERPI